MNAPSNKKSVTAPRRTAATIAFGAAVLGISFLIGAMFRGDHTRTVVAKPVVTQPATHVEEEPSRKLAKMGRLVYQIQCAKCHGAEGHGDGSDAATLKPAPRDFASTNWRFSPNAASIRRVIQSGIPETSMTSFAQILSHTELDAVTHYVSTLAPPVSAVLAPKAESAGLRPIVQQRTAPDFKMTTTDGTAVSLSQFKNKVVLITFWAPSCAPCIGKMPALDALAAQHQADGLEVLPVCVGESDVDVVTASVRGRLNRLKPLIDEGMGAVRYDVLSTPTTVLIGRDGTLLARTEGAIDWSSPALADLISAALTMTAAE